ncbi:MAG: hypothetical protein Aurels2KO_34810 [Aureliella sp.]
MTRPKCLLKSLVLLIALSLVPTDCFAQAIDLTGDAGKLLSLPKLSAGKPCAGHFVKVTPPEYRGTDVHHAVYLPDRWTADGPQLPIIFEYTGNLFPQSGSTGLVQDAALGYSASAGNFIWVPLPMINADKSGNEVTWWGDQRATVDYAKTYVPRIIKRYNADPNMVFLSGFSRGAIGVNFIGLHDDEIASLWTAFIAHDHFDGVRAWKAPWGAPLAKYQAAAKRRLARVAGRPYWVSQNGNVANTEAFIRGCTASCKNFRFVPIPTREILGEFPNRIALTSHTDRWPLVPSRQRDQLRQWMQEVVDQATESETPR